MMCPRRPTTWTRSSPWVNSKTGVPSTYDRFDFPPLRIVAIRIEALNFSVTMSRRTERLARKGLYLTVCRWMFRPVIPRARVSSSARAPRASRARSPRKRKSDRFRRMSWIRCVHDGRDYSHAGDPVAGQEAGVLRIHPADGEHGERRPVHDRVEDVQRQYGLLRLCRAWKERSAGEVIRAAVRGGRLFAWPAVHCDADDCLRSEHCPRDPWGGIVASDVAPARARRASGFRSAVTRKRAADPLRSFPQPPPDGPLFLRAEGPLVA